MDEVSTSMPSIEIKKPKAEADYTAGIYILKLLPPEFTGCGDN
jgi:hypothetical protein